MQFIEKNYPSKYTKIIDSCTENKFAELLFINEKYEQLIEMEEILTKNSHDSYYFLGRAYKEFGFYKQASNYFKVHLENVTSIERVHEFDYLLKSNYILSAYFHLAESLFIEGELEDAKDGFYKCMELTNNNHKKAREYLNKY